MSDLPCKKPVRCRHCKPVDEYNLGVNGSMSQDGTKADSKGRMNPYAVTPPGGGPSPPNEPENRKLVFPSSQSDPSVYAPEKDSGHAGEASRMLTPTTGNISVTFRPGSGGPDSLQSGERRTITRPRDAPQDLLRDVVPENDGAGSPFGIGPQSEAYVKRSRVVVNPKAKGENQH